MTATIDDIASQGAARQDLKALIADARSDFETLQDARLFITGGTGYIGRWLLEAISYANTHLNLGMQAVILSRDPDRFATLYPHLANDSALSFIKGDVREFHIENPRFTHIIHAATDVIAVNSPLDVFDVTVQGTRRVLDLARDSGATKVLLLSSGAVYGRNTGSGDRFSEASAVSTEVSSTNSAYGLGKINTEWLGNTYGQQYGFACKSARIFAQIGPYLELDAQFAAGNFMRDAMLNRPITIKGDGNAVRSYMYATDLVEWLIAILVRGQAGKAYNVGSDDPVSIAALAQTIARIAGLNQSKVQILGQTVKGAAPDLYVPETHATRTELGLSIRVSLEDALTRTMEWYKPIIASRKQP